MRIEVVLLLLNVAQLALIVFGVVTVLRIRNSRDVRITELNKRVEADQDIKETLREQVRVLSRSSFRDP